jgi:hypothetical protein
LKIELAGSQNTMIGSLITLPARLYLRGARTALHLAEDVTGRAVIATVRVAATLSNLRPGGGSSSVTPTRATPAGPARATPTRRPRTGEQAQRERRTSEREASRANGRPADAPHDGPERDRRATGEEIPRDPRAAAATVELEPQATESPDEAASELASERLEREGLAAPIDLDAPATREPEHVSEEAVLVEESAEAGAEDGAGANVHIAEPWEGYARMGAREVIARLEGASPAELAAVQLYESAGRNRQTVKAAVERRLRGVS